MNKFFLITCFTLLFSCANVKKFSAEKNKNGNLIGITSKKDFKQEPYASEWFNDYYSYYQTDKKTIEHLKPLLKNVTIKGFMGTWCDDSRREVPNFYKILDQSEFKLNQLELVAVNRNKKAKGLEKGYSVERIPTFIFYKNGKEIGRFVEHTVNGASLEHDILAIISGKGYKHAYQK